MDNLDNTTRKLLVSSFSSYLQEVSKLFGPSSPPVLNRTKKQIQAVLRKKTETRAARKGRSIMRLFMSYDKTANALANIVNKLREKIDDTPQQGIGPVWNLADHPGQAFYGGGRRKKRRRQKGGAAVAILGWCAITLGLGVRWWAMDAQIGRVGDEAGHLIDLIKGYGINLWRLADYQYLHAKDPHIYPPLRDRCALGGPGGGVANRPPADAWADFDMPFEEAPSRAVVPHKEDGSPKMPWDRAALPAPGEAAFGQHLIPAPFKQHLIGAPDPGRAHSTPDIRADQTPAWRLRAPFTHDDGTLMSCMDIIQGEERDPAIKERKDYDKFSASPVDVWTIVMGDPKGFVKDIHLALQALARDKAEKKIGAAAANVNLDKDMFGLIGSILGFAAGASKGDLLKAGAAEVAGNLKVIQHELKGVEIEVGLIERRASLALIEIAGYQKFKWGADALIKFGGFMVFGGNFGVGALKYGALTAFGVPGLAALPLAQAQGLGDVPAFGWGGDGRRTGARGWGDARRRGPPIHISPPGMSPGFLRDVALPALARRGGTRHKRRTKRRHRRHHRRKTRHKGKRKRARTRRRQRRRKRHTRR